MLAQLDPGRLRGFMWNGMKRQELVATDSVLLHEVYFDSLGSGEPMPDG